MTKSQLPWSPSISASSMSILASAGMTPPSPGDGPGTPNKNRLSRPLPPSSDLVHGIAAIVCMPHYRLGPSTDAVTQIKQLLDMLWSLLADQQLQRQSLLRGLYRQHTLSFT